MNNAWDMNMLGVSIPGGGAIYTGVNNAGVITPSSIIWVVNISGLNRPGGE